MKLQLLVVAWALLITSACASTRVVPNAAPTINESQYESVLEKNSDRLKKYKGLHNTMDVRAVLLSQEMSMAQLQYRSYLYQWDMKQWEDSLVESEKNGKKETEVFVSFFTPEKKIDDLHKSKTLWKIFLDAGGQRYEGKAKKISLPTSELIGFYPEHNRFSTPYMVTFPVPREVLNGKKIQLTITGSVDSATLNLN